jgi:PhoPQ-activated pathogenicity-related protein
MSDRHWRIQSLGSALLLVAGFLVWGGCSTATSTGSGTGARPTSASTAPTPSGSGAQDVSVAVAPTRNSPPSRGASRRSNPALNVGLTALDRYVASPDPTYSWKVVDSRGVDGVRLTVLEMVSQTWLTPAEVDSPVWKHRMIIARPESVTSSTALLMIGGGSNADDKPARPRPEVVAVARATGTVVAELGMIPNQPLIFGNDGQPRFEDDLIAYTWDRYLRTGDERWPARLPMTKAAVRAMDTVTAFCASEQGGGIEVNQFVVAGGSKRGWTTWTTAIVDPRVVAIAPIVIDVLNVEASMKHHYQAYGFFAPAVGDYVRHGIMDWMGTPEMEALRRIEDPYYYRDRLALPKLLINACGDQFFLPDSAQFYFDDLTGPKYLRYVPNADHSLRDSDALETLLAWHHVVTRGMTPPRFTWEHLGEGRIRVVTQDEPESLSVWKVTNPLARDFRLETVGPAWAQMHVTKNGTGVYELEVDLPSMGWRAFFVELVYDVGAEKPLKLTTDVRVIPDELPHAPYQPEETPRGFLQGRRR